MVFEKLQEIIADQLDVDKEEIKEQAEASLKDTVKALTLPLIGDEYQLEFKPIAEYNEEADSNA